MLNWILLFVTVLLPVIAAINGKRTNNISPREKSALYLKDILVSALIVAVFLVLKPDIYFAKDYFQEKGFEVSDDIVSGLITIFMVPFFLALTPWNNYYPKRTATKDLLGYPVALLPNDRNQWLIFTLYIVVGAFFEEFICRLCMFYFFFHAFHFTGDTLVVSSSLLFAAGHTYQSWKGIIGSLAIGLILGKIFLLKESIAYPIGLHLFLNLTLVVLAYRRLKDLKLRPPEVRGQE
jgi:membrane protease YdiL (CAAX protease family)